MNIENSSTLAILERLMFNRLGLIAILSLIGSTGASQISYTGSAVASSCGCHDITPDLLGQNGSISEATLIDLTIPWSLQFRVNFGCSDGGGEGIAFVMETGAWLSGSGGYGIGYEGVAGDIMAVEFDTRDNDAAGEISNSDVAHDHISLQDNGDIDHAIANPNNLLGISPTQIYPGTDDMEDCLNHYIQIDWTPGASQTIEVYVDGVLSLTYTANMVAGQFSGTSMVTWGWTGSTGAVLGSNQQIVCTTFAPQIDIDADATYCDGDPIADLTVISATTGTVTWYDDPGLTSIVGTGLTFTPPGGPGTYVYYATETELSLGCEGDPDSVTIVINPIPPAPIITGPTVYCQDDIPTPLMAETSFSGDVTWYDAPPPATILSTLDDYNPPTNFPGIFNYYVTESVGGCEGPATLVTVTIKPKPDPPTISGTMQYCEGDIPTALTATPSMGGTIEWFDSGLSLLFTGLIFTPTLTIGTNTFIVTETLAGCSSDDTIITITVDPAPYVNVAPSISACYGDAVIIAADTNGYPLTWSSGQTGTPISYFTDTTEWLYVTATNPLCGSSMDSIQVIINALPYVAAFSDTSIGLGAEIKLYASTGASNVTFQWIPPVDECIYPDCSIVFDAPDQATIYIVIATDDNGCQHSDTLFVDIIGLMEIFVPNVFSPNNDGWNDLLEVEGPKLYDFDFRVFDRWGKLMYKSTDQRSGWDGTFDGQELAPQTFVYMVRGETVLGKKIKVQGNVSIIK